MSSRENLLAVYDTKELWKPYHEQVLCKLSASYRVRLCLLENGETGSFAEASLRNCRFSIDRKDADIGPLLQDTDVVLFFTLSCESMERAMKMDMTDPYAELVLTALYEGKQTLVLQHWLSGAERTPGILTALEYWRSCVKRLGLMPVYGMEAGLLPAKGTRKTSEETEHIFGKTRWLTEEDINRWAAESPSPVLKLGAEEKMTPLAVDRAKELSIEITRHGNGGF